MNKIILHTTILLLAISGISYSATLTTARDYGKDSKTIYYTFKKNKEIYMIQLVYSPSKDKRNSRVFAQNMSGGRDGKRHKYNKKSFDTAWNMLHRINLRKYETKKFFGNPETHHVIMVIRGGNLAGRKMYLIPKNATPRDAANWVMNVRRMAGK